MTKIDILDRWQSRSLGASIFTLGICSGFTIPASAQITYEGGKAAAQTTPGNFTIPVTEGKQTDGNLFHSFGTFGVPTNGAATFEANNSVQNILGRVTGGTPSLVDGRLQVTGGNANLFLMNPAGIVFGKGASLDINGAFTATTAKAIDFNGKWFNALGTNNYSELTGNPIGLAFTGSTPGSIFSAATLSNVQPGKSITLVGGTVISTGDIKTAGGNISIATVEGGKYVQIKVEGSILGLNLPAAVPTYINSINSAPTSFKPQSLAELLTNTKVDLAATGVKNENGVVTLVGEPSLISAAISRGDTVSKQNRSIISGDIIVQNLNTSAFDVSGGNVYFDSSRAILIGNINTNRTNSSGRKYVAGELNSYGGKVVLKGQTEIVAGVINSETTPLENPNDKNLLLPTAGGDITLSTQTGDIIVESISTTSSTNNSDLKDRITVRGGDLTVNAKGLFRVITNTELTSIYRANSISSGPFGKINIKHGGISFVTGADEESLEDFGNSQLKRKVIEGFKFLDRQSGARGFIFTSRFGNGSYGVVYTNSRGFYDFGKGASGADGSTVQSVIPKIGTPGTNNQDKNSDGGKTDPKVAKNTSGDNSGEQDSTKDNSDNQASKPGDSEEDKQKAKKRKQKAKCNNSSAIASAKLGTDPTRSGNIANSAAEELCPPNIDNGILQILTDRN